MPTPAIVPGVRALKQWIGKSLGVTEWLTITQEQIQAFADATGDRQWIHVDVERARSESPFRGTIAHGYLTLALAPRLLPQLVDVQGTRLVVNYGIEKLRLPAPVPAGARIRMGAEVKAVRDIPGGAARVTLGIQFEIEGQRKSACTADLIYVYVP